MAVSEVRLDRISGGSSDGLLRPNTPPAEPLPPIIYGHGAGGAGWETLTGSGVGNMSLLHRLADMGYTIVFPSNTALWGNSISEDRWTEAIQFARENGAHPTSKAILMGASMGGFTATRYAATHPENALCVVTFVPALDIDYHVLNNTLGLRGQINAAWGRAAGDTSAFAAGINPTTMTSVLSQVPQQHWYATDDTVSANIGTYATATGCDLRSVGALGHTEAAIAAANDDEIIRFITSFGPVQTETAQPFSPLSIAWDGAWWASYLDQPLFPDSTMNLWKDATGGLIDLHDFGAGGGINPTFKAAVPTLNNKPAVLFNGTTNWIGTSTTVWPATSAWDLFLVFKQSSVNVGTYKVLASTISGGTLQPEFLTNVDNDWWMYAGVGISTGTPDTNPHCLIGRYNGASSEMELDGSVIGTGNVGTFQLRDFILGIRGGGGFPWGGHIAFAGVKRTTLLTTQERSDLVDWSRDFYGTP